MYVWHTSHHRTEGEWLVLYETPARWIVACLVLDALFAPLLRLPGPLNGYRLWNWGHLWTDDACRGREVFRVPLPDGLAAATEAA